MAILLFYITCPDEATAKKIADTMVQESLAACSNIFPIQSAFWWDGAAQHDAEWVSLLKTRPSLEDALENALTAIHPYDVPCFMRWEVQANQAYVDWIYANTGLF